MLDLIAAAKAAAAPAAAPRRSNHRKPIREDGAADGEASDDKGDDEHASEEQESEGNDYVEPEVGTEEGDGAEAPEAAQAAGPGMQTFVFSATLTLPLALRRRLQKRARCTLMSCPHACHPRTSADCAHHPSCRRCDSTHDVMICGLVDDAPLRLSFTMSKL